MHQRFSLPSPCHCRLLCRRSLATYSYPAFGAITSLAIEVMVLRCDSCLIFPLMALLPLCIPVYLLLPSQRPSLYPIHALLCLAEVYTDQSQQGTANSTTCSLPCAFLVHYYDVRCFSNP